MLRRIESKVSFTGSETMAGETTVTSAKREETRRRRGQPDSSSTKEVTRMLTLLKLLEWLE
jgi:hypothetical protein